MLVGPKHQFQPREKKYYNREEETTMETPKLKQNINMTPSIQKGRGTKSMKSVPRVGASV